jgi:hypothetical protein
MKSSEIRAWVSVIAMDLRGWVCYGRVGGLHLTGGVNVEGNWGPNEFDFIALFFEIKICVKTGKYREGIFFPPSPSPPTS